VWCALADNVGDNVGDIAGMGADLFGSFAESTCAALVVASVSSIGMEHSWLGMMFPLSVTAAGILVCLFTTLLATDIVPAQNVPGIEPALKMQLVVSTLVMTPVVFFVALFTLPTTFTIPQPGGDMTVQWWYMFVCVSVGLWGGLTIGLVTEYYTSNTYKPVQEVASSCRTGAATNVIFGLALGYLSVIIPVFVISIAIFTGMPPHLPLYAPVFIVLRSLF
jgi:H+-translocating diphosphatase